MNLLNYVIYVRLVSKPRVRSEYRISDVGSFVVSRVSADALSVSSWDILVFFDRPRTFVFDFGVSRSFVDTGAFVVSIWISCGVSCFFGRPRSNLLPDFGVSVVDLLTCVFELVSASTSFGSYKVRIFRFLCGQKMLSILKLMIFSPALQKNDGDHCPKKFVMDFCAFPALQYVQFL